MNLQNIKPDKLLRQIHHWGSVLIMLQMGVVIIAGLFLLLKKEVAWIQPETQRSAIETTGAPATSLEDLYAAVRTVPEFSNVAWTDLSRVDIKPDKGVVKFVAPSNWEAQIDLVSGEVLQVAYRRSDMIEALHDGSFFADWVKLYIFLPSGLGLLILWATGVYLFFLPYVKRYSRRRGKRQSNALMQSAE